MVIVILGVLAVFAAPRMLNSNDFNARGFHDETLSLLRYAQKSAIAQRRTVCVTFSQAAPATAVLAIASAAASNNCNTALTGPNQNCIAGLPTGSKGCVTAKSGISYSSGPASLNFDGLGLPQAFNSSGTALASVPVIQVSEASGAITVETGTGYVHD
jgi:MSHA pilin protein MshC